MQVGPPKDLYSCELFNKTGKKLSLVAEYSDKVEGKDEKKEAKIDIGGSLVLDQITLQSEKLGCEITKTITKFTVTCDECGKTKDFAAPFTYLGVNSPTKDAKIWINLGEDLALERK